MALRARRSDVGAGERESYSGMGERGGEPRRRIVAERTRRWEARRHVIRILGGGVVFDVAAIAIGGYAQELIIDMARGAGQRGVRAHQRETEIRMIKPTHVDRQPDIHAVALS